MSQRLAIHYIDTQIGLMSDRWQRGKSLHQIAQLLIGIILPSAEPWLRPAASGLPSASDRIGC